MTMALDIAATEACHHAVPESEGKQHDPDSDELRNAAVIFDPIQSEVVSTSFSAPSASAAPIASHLGEQEGGLGTTMPHHHPLAHAAMLAIDAAADRDRRRWPNQQPSWGVGASGLPYPQTMRAERL